MLRGAQAGTTFKQEKGVKGMGHAEMHLLFFLLGWHFYSSFCSLLKGMKAGDKFKKKKKFVLSVAYSCCAGGRQVQEGEVRVERRLQPFAVTAQAGDKFKKEEFVLSVAYSPLLSLRRRETSSRRRSSC
jgi:hypothetical protein